MKCEVVREGQACSNAAEFIVRTPWTTQLACIDCAPSFKRYETQKLEFFCDWPVGGKECGEPATHYIETSDHPTLCHRPLCATHATKCVNAIPIGEYFNPRLVSYKPAPQPQPRVEQKADGTVALRCHCGAAGKYRGGVEPMPLCDEHWTPTPKAEPMSPDVAAPTTDVISALEDLAVAVLQALTKKVEALTKKVQK